MKTNELLDSWSISGTDLAEFKGNVEDIAQSTYVANVKTCDVTMLHLQGVADKKLVFNVLSKQQIEERKSIGTRLDAEALAKNGASEDFLAELQDTKLMLRLNQEGAQREDVYFTSSHLSRDLAARAQLAGDAVYDPTIERDTYIMSRYVKLPETVMAVIRRNSGENNAIHKVFAFPSAAYRQIDQRLLLDIIDQLEMDLGTCECRRWTMNHYLTQIWLSFPEKAKDVSDVYGLPDAFTPGVLLETSDTGDSSVRVIAFWERTRDSFARLGGYEREHRGNISEVDILANMKKRVMPKYTELPMRLCELLRIDIPDPEAALERIFKMVGMKQAFGKKRTENLLDIMTGLVASSASMTAYEMAMMFLDLPTRFEMDSLVREAAENIAGRVPFLDFEKIAKSSTAVTML